MVARGAVHAVAHNSFTVPVSVCGWRGSRVHVEMHVCNKRNWPVWYRFEAFVIRVQNIEMKLQKLFFFVISSIGRKNSMEEFSYTQTHAFFFFFLNYFIHLSGEDSFSAKRHLMRGH